MKQLLILIALTMILSLLSQETEKTGSGLDWYAAAGISIGNSGSSTFAATSYPSVEFGFMNGNWALGLVAGRSNNDFTQDQTSNYWWSIKNAAYFPI